jgi:hypothetical protein
MLTSRRASPALGERHRLELVQLVDAGLDDAIDRLVVERNLGEAHRSRFSTPERGRA